MTGPEARGGSPQEPAPPKDMFSPSQIRTLKIAVIGMGAILLAGFVLVIGRIIHLVNRAPTAPVAAAVSNGGRPYALTPLRLPSGGVVRHIAISGDRLAVHYEAPGDTGIIVLDMVSGVWGAVPITFGGAGGQRGPVKTPE